MKFNIKWLLYLSILFLFLPSFAFYVPSLHASYMFLYLIIYVSIITLFLFEPKKLIGKIIHYYKITPFKYFIILICLIIINSIIVSIFGISSFSLSIRSVVMKIFLGALPIYILLLHIVDKYISYKSFIKTFVFLFWLTLIINFIFIISHLFNITIVNDIFDFLNNARSLTAENSGLYYNTSESYAIGNSGMVRLYGFFGEPSLCARFLFIFMPIIYSISCSNIIFYKNKYINILIKKTLIPFTWINLILTMSPMFLIFSSIITIFYFKREIIYAIKKYKIFLFIFAISLLLIIIKMDFSNTYLSRIINVVTQVNSFEKFNAIEPSLATRIENYINSLGLFLKSPIFGVGIGNSPYVILNQYLYSPVPLSPFILQRINLAIINNCAVPFDYGFIYYFLAEFGLISFCVFVLYYYKIITFFKKYIEVHKNNNFYNIVANGIYSSLMSIIILFFYDLEYFRSIELHLIIIFALAFIYHYKTITMQKGISKND